MNTRVPLLSLVLGLAFLEASPASAAGPAAQKPLALNPHLGDEIDAYVAPLLQRNDFSGVILVAQGGHTLFQQAYGLASREYQVPNTPQTRFMIGSIAKQFTAAGILILQDQGKLQLSDPLGHFIPDFPRGDEITLYHLLSHTSGLARDLPDLEHTMVVPHTLAELVALVAPLPLSFAPGQGRSYSNNGYRLLAYVIERVSGERYADFLQQHIFAKLDMRDTGELEDQDLVPGLATGYNPWLGPQGLGRAFLHSVANGRGPGSLYSTVGDLYKWDRSFQGTLVLSEAAKAQMLSEEKGFGTGIHRQWGRLCIGHNGVYYGYTGFIERYPAEDVSILYLGNIETGGSIDPLQAALAAIVFNQPYEPAQQYALQATPPPEALAQYAGRYEVFPGFILTVKEARGHLLLGAGDGFFPLDPQGEDCFFYRLKYATVTFVRDEHGTVNALNWKEGSGTYPCKKL